RFTNQSLQCNIHLTRGIGWGIRVFGARRRAEDGASSRIRMEIVMTTKFPVLPVAGSTVLRASLALISLVTHWLKNLARARRHRREARALAGLDRRMLADIGISRADLRDAFSEPFW